MAQVKNLEFAEENSILDDEDDATLAAIDDGIKAADEGRVGPRGSIPETHPTVDFKIHYAEPALADLEALMRWSWEKLHSNAAEQEPRFSLGR